MYEDDSIISELNRLIKERQHFLDRQEIDQKIDILEKKVDSLIE